MSIQISQIPQIILNNLSDNYNIDNLTHTLSRISENKQNLYLYNLEQYLLVSKEIESFKPKSYSERQYIDRCIARQARLCNEIYELSLTCQDKIELYDINRVDLIPPDGFGQDEKYGKILPTETEIKIGMYPDRSLYYFRNFTCGIFIFYSTYNNWRYIGKSQYIEVYIHSKMLSYEKGNLKKLPTLKYMLDNHIDTVRFQVIEKVPYSLLDYALLKNREKYNNMHGYSKKKFRDYDFVKGKYNY